MVDRRSFLKSLANGEQNANHQIDSGAPRGRRSYFASLGAGAASASGGPRRAGELGRSVVSFSVASILEFKGGSQIAAAYKQPRQAPRVRPNYDNSRRQLFANPEVRQSQLTPGSKVDFDSVLSFLCLTVCWNIVVACDSCMWQACRKWILFSPREEAFGQTILPVSSSEVFQKMCF